MNRILISEIIIISTLMGVGCGKSEQGQKVGKKQSPQDMMVFIGNNAQRYKEYKHEQTGLTFILIPGGSFQMGNKNGYVDEKPAHEVTVSDFFIAKYELTQGVYQKIMGNNPSYFQKGDNYPVEHVTWEDCQNFCKKTGLKLPTEAQWEYASRGGTSDIYYWGNKPNGDYMWYIDNSGGTTHPVGEKKPNGFGLYDTIGNVWEWCYDYYDEYYYKHSPKDNPTGPDRSPYHTQRGGCWCNPWGHVGVSVRNNDRGVLPSRYDSVGLRPAADVK